MPDKPFEVELIVGNCVLYPAAAIRETGLLDEKRLPQFGDAEYTPRIRKRGWRLLIEPRARVFCKPNDLVAGFRKLPWTKKIEELFSRDTGPYSLKRRFNMNFYGGPTKLQGLLAVNLFFLRKLVGRNVEGEYGNTQREDPLSKTLAASTVRDDN
jgi:GT2 family glycosyltransferase